MAADVNATPLPDPVQEGLRIIRSTRERDLDVYLLGGIAVEARRPPEVQSLRSRPFNDIDIITSRQAGRDITGLLVALGYEADQQFNVVNGRSRMLFRDPDNERDLDVLIGEFAMCHELPVLEHASTEELTIPLADLLLTKLQIIELNPKDLWDAYNLLHAHDVSQGIEARSTIDAGRIATLCAREWGLWRTVTQNLGVLLEPGHASALPPEAHSVVRSRVARLQAAIEQAKKSRRWTMRSRIGDRVRWYEEPEEAH